MIVWSLSKKMRVDSKRLAHYLQLWGGGVDLAVPPLASLLNADRSTVGNLQVRSSQICQLQDILLAKCERAVYTTRFAVA